MSESGCGGSTGPKRIEPDELRRRLQGRAAAREVTDERTVAHAGSTITGRLVRHGPARYEFQQEGSPSYFVELNTSTGPKRLWGVDLGRALAEAASQPKVGDLVGAQRAGYQEVVAGGETLRRTIWRVERVTLLAEEIQRARSEREQLLRDRAERRAQPELRSAYVSMTLAREYAERRIRDPVDREQFLKRLREVMAASTAPVEPRPGRGVREPDGPTR